MMREFNNLCNLNRNKNPNLKIRSIEDEEKWTKMMYKNWKKKKGEEKEVYNIENYDRNRRMEESATIYADDTSIKKR